MLSLPPHAHSWPAILHCLGKSTLKLQPYLERQNPGFGGVVSLQKLVPCCDKEEFLFGTRSTQIRSIIQPFVANLHSRWWLPQRTHTRARAHTHRQCSRRTQTHIHTHVCTYAKECTYSYMYIHKHVKYEARRTAGSCNKNIILNMRNHTIRFFFCGERYMLACSQRLQARMCVARSTPSLVCNNSALVWQPDMSMHNCSVFFFFKV